jgi:hypothetical protein
MSVLVHEALARWLAYEAGRTMAHANGEAVRWDGAYR